LSARENDRNYPLRHSAISDFKPKVKQTRASLGLPVSTVTRATLLSGVEMDESQGRLQVGEDQRAAAERVKELRLGFIAQQQ
jgi:hypothetical protein